MEHLKFGSNPSFTLEQWVSVIGSIETLQEFGVFEEMFRTDCFRNNWRLQEIMPVKKKFGEKLEELRQSK